MQEEEELTADQTRIKADIFLVGLGYESSAT
jgi:hypothetical protein